MALLQAFGFIATILLATGLGQYYLWRRLVRSTTRTGSVWRRRGRIASFVLWLLPAAAVGIGRTSLPSWVVLPVEYVGYIWLALLLYLVLVLAVLEIPRLLLNRRIAGRDVTEQTTAEEEPSAPDQSAPEQSVAPEESGAPTTSAADQEKPTGPILDRRLVLARGLALTAGVVAAGTVGYGVSVATAPVPFRRTTISLSRLDSSLSGLRVAVLGDLHLGDINGKDFMSRVVDRVNGEQPDLIAICGDLVDGSVAELTDAVGPLADLESKYGSFFVTGNHEYFGGAQEWIDYLPELGVDVLHNRRVTLGEGPATIDIAGVDDETAADSGQAGQGADYKKALSGRDEDKPVILLAHQPIQVDNAAALGVDLQISAHTHGGQLWPFNYVVRAQQGYVAGRYDVGDTQLYVTRGAGFWGPPVRVGAPPEISILTLESGS